VYGSDTELANQLRLFSGGQLLYNKIGNQDYCPQDQSKVVKKGNETQVTVAFVAGNRQFLNTKNNIVELNSNES